MSEISDENLKIESYDIFFSYCPFFSSLDFAIL